jgi:hypothetical protein
MVGRNRGHRWRGRGCGVGPPISASAPNPAAPARTSPTTNASSIPTPAVPPPAKDHVWVGSTAECRATSPLPSLLKVRWVGSCSSRTVTVRSISSTGSGAGVGQLRHPGEEVVGRPDLPPAGRPVLRHDDRPQQVGVQFRRTGQPLLVDLRDQPVDERLRVVPVLERGQGGEVVEQHLAGGQSEADRDRRRVVLGRAPLECDGPVRRRPAGSSGRPATRARRPRRARPAARRGPGPPPPPGARRRPDAGRAGGDASAGFPNGIEGATRRGYRWGP